MLITLNQLKASLVAFKDWVLARIPSKTSDLTNDSNFITTADLPTKVSDLVDDSGHYTKPLTGIPASDLASGVIPTVPVQDVTVNGTSVVSNGIAEIVQTDKSVWNMFVGTLNPDMSSADKYPHVDGQAVATMFRSCTPSVAEHGFRATATGMMRVDFGNENKSNLNGFEVGETYTLSCDLSANIIRPSSLDEVVANIEIQLMTYNGYYGIADGYVSRDIEDGEYGTDVDFGRVEFTFTVPERKDGMATTGAMIRIVPIINGTYALTEAGSYVEVRNLMLNKGNGASSWSPSLSEVVSEPPVQDVQINGTSIVDSGVANIHVPEIDTTLTVAGKAADAKKVGDEITNVNRQISDETTGLDSKASVIVETASGAIASFDDGADGAPVKGLSVAIEPVQDLHGYDSPWPAGGGKNLLDPGTDETINGVTKRVNSDGTITFSGTATITTDFYFNGTTPSYTAYPLPNGTYHIEGSEEGSTQTYSFFWIYQKDGGTKYTNGHDHTIVTVDGEIPSRIFFRVYTGYTINLTVRLGLFNGAYQADAWTPYSNICPITGWTGAEISHSGADTSSPETYNITFPSEAGTVYGGTLDVTTGVLTVDRAWYAFNGEESQWIKSSTYRGSFYRSWITMPSGIGINRGTFICSHAGYVSNLSEYAYGKCVSDSALNLWVIQDPDATINDLTAFLAEQYANGTPVTVCYTLATPQTYQLTPQEIRTLLGINNIWADTGDTEVIYLADTKLYIDNNDIVDVQINGTSIVDNGVANIPIAGVDGNTPILGVVAVNPVYGIKRNANNGLLQIATASPNDCKVQTGATEYKPITVYTMHNAAFYGLAKAAGDTTQSVSSNPVGTYTDEAKSAIKNMLGVSEVQTVTVSGTDPVITAVDNTRYVCGEVTSLSFTPCASGICDVIFTSGSTVAVLTLPNTVNMPDGFEVEANTTYEINILDGVYGSVMSWT